MAFTTYRRTASERLDVTKGWEAKGLTYWAGRVSACRQRIAQADSFSDASRARDDLELAQEAVRRLSPAQARQVQAAQRAS